MNHALSAYLPMDRCHGLATGQTLPTHSWGAVLFADISGFTSLTEALTRELGPRRGAEELPRLLNLVYDALIEQVSGYGGSVVGFAGDAITCWFDEDSGRRAAACGLAMQAAMQPFSAMVLPSGGVSPLAIRIGIASGPVRRFLVGHPEIQLIDTLAGATLHRMVVAEQIARTGEVVLAEATARGLGEGLEVREWRTDESGTPFAVVGALREAVPRAPWPPLPLDRLQPEVLRPWLLPAVYERLQAGQGELLTELRPAVALFLRFRGIDYDGDAEAGEKLDRYVRWVQHRLTQYGGTLLQLTIGEKGSYLYAAFGAPIAHEDDARRAALAALALRTPPYDLAFIVETQLGLSWGTMRTGAYGSATRRTYGALGDEVNLAARLMQHAQPGQIIASERIQSATPLFEWQALAQIRVKGKVKPISIFALLGERHTTHLHLTEPDARLPLIGRAQELALIERKLELTLRGRGQLVGITGEAGMGKSRLIAEVIGRAEAWGFTGYGGECHSYGTNTSYLVWQPLWRAFFELQVSDPPEQQVAQLERSVAALDPTLLPRLPLLGPLLNLPIPNNEMTRTLSPELRKTSREAMLVDLLKRRARTLLAQQGAGLLLVLEDCHWLDPASHDLLEVIGRAIWQEPVLILLAYRPPELDRLNSPRVISLPYFTPIALTELTELDALQFVMTRLAQLWPDEAQPPSEALLRRVIERAQGNPFYLEELLNYLHDQGLPLSGRQAVEQLDLPTSLHRLILSRIDRLTEPQKVTLKVASIIGRLFRFHWLRDYYPLSTEPEQLKRDLEALSQLDLTPLESQEPELIYLFKHIITREVAYESLPYATRARLHEQLAAWLEQQGSTAVDGYLDLLAYHYSQSENQAKTREYLRRAGEAAQASYANAAAEAYYERLLPLLEEPLEQVDLHLRLGAVRELVGQWEQAEAHYHSARTLAPPASEAAARSAQALGKLYRNRGDFGSAQRWLAMALDEWVQLGEEEPLRQALADIGILAMRQADYARALEYLGRSRVMCQARGDQSGLAYAINNLGILAMNRGDYAEARLLFEESLALRRALADRWGIAVSLNNLGIVANDQGRYEEAQALHEESLALQQEMGVKRGIAASLNNLGLVALNLGHYERARGLTEECLALRREMQDTFGTATSLSNLGDVLNKLGDREGARQRYEESLALRRQMSERAGIAISLNSLGELAYRRGDRQEALAYHRASLELAQEIGEKMQMVSALVGLAALLHTERPLSAILLLASAERLRLTMDATLESIFRTLYEEVLSTTRGQVEESAFEESWRAGQHLSPEEAVALVQDIE